MTVNETNIMTFQDVRDGPHSRGQKAYLDVFTNETSNTTYMIRYKPWYHSSDDNQDNCWISVFEVDRDTGSIELMVDAEINKTTFGTDTFAISQVRVCQNELYVLDRDHGMYRFTEFNPL